MTPDAARRLYRHCPRLAPRGLRQEHGAEMEELFLERRTEAVRGGGKGAASRAWIRALADVVVRQSMTARATYSFLLAVFAGLAVVLAIGGAYGVTAYLATQRTREIGIRLALGAQKADIRRGVLLGSLRVVGVGIVLGLLSSLGAARALQSLLFGVRPHDLAVQGAAAAVMLLTALAATWLPAARAARVDPMTTLRGD